MLLQSNMDAQIMRQFFHVLLIIQYVGKSMAILNFIYAHLYLYHQSMISLHPHPCSQTLPLLPLKHNQSQSQRTEASSQRFLVSGRSIICSTSSLILEEADPKQPEKQLFAKYLFENNQKERNSIFSSMQKLYMELPIEKRQSMEMSLNLSESESDQEGQVLTYFTNIWLRDMGYGQERSKKEVGKLFKIYRGDGQVLSFMKMYHNLNAIPLKTAEKRIFFANVCKNGWQYFVRFVVKNNIINRDRQSSSKELEF